MSCRRPTFVPKVGGTFRPSGYAMWKQCEWLHLVQSQVRFNRVAEKAPEKVPEKVWEAFVQSQVRLNRVSGEGLGEFGAELSQVRFNSVPEKVPEGPGSTSFRRRFWRRFRKGFAAARFNEASSMFRCHSGSVSAQLLGQVPANFRRTNCENKLLLLLGIPPKLVF